LILAEDFDGIVIGLANAYQGNHVLFLNAPCNGFPRSKAITG
jgi:hypothetical protein